MRFVSWLLRLIGAVLFVAFGVLLLAHVGRIRAHEFYAAECCSDQDCRTLDETEVPTLLRAQPDGRWLIVRRGIVVEKKGLSPDGKFHLCETPSAFRCLYVPEPES